MAFNAPDKCCLKCHFLEHVLREDMKELDNGTDFQHLTSALTGHRETIVNGIQGQNSPSNLFRMFKCHFAIWGPWLCLENKHMFQEVMKRRNDCFFFPYADGMSIPVAVELEKRRAEQDKAEKDRALTRKAFLIAIAALIVSIIALIANLVWDVWKYFHLR